MGPQKTKKQAMLILAMIIGLMSLMVLLVMYQHKTKEPIATPKVGYLITTVFENQYACTKFLYSDMFAKGFNCTPPVDEVWIPHDNVKEILIWKDE